MIRVMTVKKLPYTKRWLRTGFLSFHASNVEHLFEVSPGVTKVWFTKRLNNGYGARMATTNHDHTSLLCEINNELSWLVR